VIEAKKHASVKYTKGVSEKLVAEMKTKTYSSIYKSLFPEPEHASVEAKLVLEEVCIHTHTHIS
jgi:hypothetical protein